MLIWRTGSTPVSSTIYMTFKNLTKINTNILVYKDFLETFRGYMENTDRAITTTVGNVSHTMFKPEIKVKKPLNWPMNTKCRDCDNDLLPNELKGICSDCE